MNQTPLSVFSLALFLGSMVASASGLDRLVGYYETPSVSCTNTRGGCPATFRDCLKVKRDSKGARAKAIVELYSVQAYESICSFRLTMKFENGNLRHDFGNNSSIEIARRGQKVYVISSNVDPHALGICGAHGDLDDVSFPVRGRKMNDAIKCYSK
jgi:hypothetical protein